MALDPKTFGSMTEQTTFRLIEPHQLFEKGTLVHFCKHVSVHGRDILMVATEGGKPFGAPPSVLELAGVPSVAEETGSEESGPVFEYFAEHSDLNDEITVTLASHYINTLGVDDTDAIADMAQDAGVTSEKWTQEETAKVAKAFYVSFGVDVDPAVTQILENAEKARKAEAAAAEKAHAERAAAKTSRTPKSAPKEAPAPESEGNSSQIKTAPSLVDKASWTAAKVGALNILAALLPFYAESPDHFDGELEIALTLLKRVAK